ncbi:NlpC/P60 family protein [Parasalinivibrio latis]|uniref:C40 family peptidase n=1 Tax=Parasalinivibrio latis TaxID=2952610 RepID=UPI0030DE0AF0
MRLFTVTSVLAASLILSGCQSLPSKTPFDGSRYESVLDAPVAGYFAEWKGTPYLYGGNSKSGIDCSAFTQHAFEQLYSLRLPRTTKAQAKAGKQVSLSEKQNGDLVFFKTGKKVYHVGVYVGDNHFMHASTSKGVILSRLDNPYWTRTFWQVRRYP